MIALSVRCEAEQGPKEAGKRYLASQHLPNRVKRYKKLPSAPTKGDLEAVARKMLAMQWNSGEQKWSVAGPKPDPDFIKMVVGYALTCKMRLPAVVDTITEARHQARLAV